MNHPTLRISQASIMMARDTQESPSVEKLDEMLDYETTNGVSMAIRMPTTASDNFAHPGSYNHSAEKLKEIEDVNSLQFNSLSISRHTFNYQTCRLRNKWCSQCSYRTECLQRTLRGESK